MLHPCIFSPFSRAFRRLFHRAPNRRARRAMRRSRASSRLRLEYLESRELLSSYIIEDLGTLGGNSSQAAAINAKGEVVGSAQLADGKIHAVLWEPGKAPIDLGTLGGANSSALAINILGEIVGKADTASATDQPFALQPGGSMTNLNDALPQSFKDSGDVLNSATGVNDTGVIVGKGTFNLIDLFVVDPYSFDLASGTVNLLDVASGVGEAAGVSGTKVVSNLVSSNGTSQAVVEDINGATSVVLPTLAGITLKSSTVFGISTPNAAGIQFAAGIEVDTSGHITPVEWKIPQNSNQTTVEAQAGGFVGDPTDIVVNERRVDVVDSVRNGEHFVTADFPPLTLGNNPVFTTVDLNDLLPANSGITLESVTGINDAGQICANGTINGQEHAFRLTPVIPGPPHATLTNAPDVTTSGATTYTFVVTYTDATGIDPNTLNNAVQVSGPSAAGFLQTATLKSTSGTPTQLSATYTITPPGGSWDFSDNGTFTISLNNNVVKDISGQPLAGGTLGHFIAAINVTRGSISGTVFNDANGNGTRDAGEAGASDTDVFLDLNSDGQFDSGDRITQTDANGAYTFIGLLPGDYRVMELVGAPHGVTSPTNNVHLVHLGEGQKVTGQDFGDVTDPQITDIAGQNLAVAHGKTAQFDQPATVLHITGSNFTANDIFFFGNDQAFAGPTNFQTGSNGVQTFDLQVPAFATTGSIVVHSSRTNRFTTLVSNFTVDSYRNVNGYSFVNNGVGYSNYNLDDLRSVFGSNQVDISVDVCGILTLGLANCTVDTGIPNPLAFLELLLINQLLPPDAGQCLGFSLSSARLSLGLGQLQIGDFAAQPGTDGSTVWDLFGPSGPSADLRQLIHLAHLEQSSDEFLENYVEQIAADEVNGPSHLINGVKSELAHGRPVLICFQEGGFGGHCVLAYNVQDAGNGTEILDIYDPNNPFLASEDNGNASPNVPGVENGVAHANHVLQSTITIDSSGNWTYNAPDSNGHPSASGGMGSIAMTPLSVFSSHSLLASSLTSLLTLGVFGSAAETQVTDSAGHTLLNPDGSPNTNPTTDLPNAARYVAEQGATPLDLIQGTGNFMQSILGTGSGTYGAVSLGTDAMAAISGVSSVSGQTDKFGLDPAGDKLTFIPASNKSLTADLVINAPAGVQREAQLSSTAVGGAAQTLQFQGNQRDHVVFNPGAAGSFSLNLTSNADGQVQTFTTGRMTLAAGDSVDVLPSDWADIQNATATVKITHADGSTTTSTISNGGAGLQVNAKEGVSFTGTVAHFTNQSPTGKSAVINWGDGTTSTGIVAASGADVTVSGTHTYSKQGYFPTRITLSDTNGPLGQATGEAVVTDTQFSLTPTTIVAFAGVPFTGTVATLTDVPSGDIANDFDVTIDWGDGTTSAGTLQTTSAGNFDVRGTHTWATTGNKPVKVTVTEHGSASGQGQTLNVGSNTNFSGTVAQLQLPIPGSAPGDYVATIDWGDGTTSTGTLTLQADGSVILSGSHTFATGNRSFVTHFSLTGGPSANTTSTAVASPAEGTVTGTLFDDINGNGQQDTGEEGITGQVVFIDLNHNGTLDADEPFAVTNSSGVYTITNAPAGSIRVSEVVPTGFRVDAPASGSHTVTLNAGQTLSNLDFANTQLAQISGTVFVDANGNGTRDSSESGRANQIVFLDLNNDGVLEDTEPTAITDATGAFAFTVNPGSYVVKLQAFSDFTITTPTSGSFTLTVGAASTNSSSLFGEKLIATSPPPPPPPPPPVSPPPSPPPSPKPPPTLHTPPLLAFFDSLLGGIETVNGNNTETVIDRIFGIPLLISTYDGAGNLENVSLFGIDVTLLFELL